MSVTRVLKPTRRRAAFSYIYNVPCTMTSVHAHAQERQHLFSYCPWNHPKLDQQSNFKKFKTTTSLLSPQWVRFHNSFLKRYIHHAPKFTSLSLRYIKSLQKDILSPIKLSKNHTPLRIILLEWTRMKPFWRRCFAFFSKLKSQNINLYN